jgi:hypothetical protein
VKRKICKPEPAARIVAPASPNLHIQKQNFSGRGFGF